LLNIDFNKQFFLGGFFMSKYQDPAVKVGSADEALKLLKEGNARFVANNLVPTNYKEALGKTGTQQSPFASILTCADSRCSPEIYFDQGIGNIFVVRNAGNFADREAIGSFQFAAAVLGSKVIVVVGHTQCGAVKNAHGGTQVPFAELQGVLNDLAPIVKSSADWEKDGVPANIKAQVEALKNNPGIKEAGVPVYGANYNVATGQVTWL
jgi:carbonic anhydrase